MKKKIFNTIEEVLDAGDFFEIYEKDGEKMISFSGYIYTEGQEGYNEEGEEDESYCYRIVSYSSGMEFPLKDYLLNENLYEEAYEVRGNDYIDDATEEQALAAANSWFGGHVEFNKSTKLTMDTPVGYYVR